MQVTLSPGRGDADGYLGETVSSTLGKGLRLLGAVVLTSATVPFLGATAAYADSTSITASSGGYFYAEGIRKPDESPAAPPNVTNDRLDRVAPGNLAVAAQAGREDKVSFLLYDLLDITPGSMVTKATLTMPLVANDADNTSYAADPAKVRACMSGPEGFNGDDGNAIEDAPSRKCDAFSAPAKASADGASYVFDVTALAAGWVDGDNDGIALTAADGATTTPFQVVFASADKATLALTYTPSPELEAPILSAPEVPSTGTDSGFSGAFIPPPSDSGFGSTGSPALPEAPAPAPQPGVAPVAAAPAPAVALVARDLEVLRPTSQFWLAGLLLAGVLALLSRILGDTSQQAAVSNPSRLTRALEARQRGGARVAGFGTVAHS